MIKIVQGVYGCVEGKRVVPKDSKSDPFEISPEREAELVKMGVAVYVDGGRTALPKNVTGVPNYDESTGAKELREIGKSLGLSFPVSMSKVDMRAALDAHIAGNTEEAAEPEVEPTEDESTEVDGETPPSFDAAEAVK